MLLFYPWLPLAKVESNTLVPCSSWQGGDVPAEGLGLLPTGINCSNEKNLREEERNLWSELTLKASPVTVVIHFYKGWSWSIVCSDNNIIAPCSSRWRKYHNKKKAPQCYLQDDTCPVSLRLLAIASIQRFFFSMKGGLLISSIVKHNLSAIKQSSFYLMVPGRVIWCNTVGFVTLIHYITKWIYLKFNPSIWVFVKWRCLR